MRIMRVNGEMLFKRLAQSMPCSSHWRLTREDAPTDATGHLSRNDAYYSFGGTNINDLVILIAF